MKDRFEKLADMANAEIAKKDREERQKTGQEEMVREQFDEIYEELKFFEDIREERDENRFEGVCVLKNEKRETEISLCYGFFSKEYKTIQEMDNGRSNYVMHDLTIKTVGDRFSVVRYDRGNPVDIASLKSTQAIVQVVMQWAADSFPELCQNARNVSKTAVQPPKLVVSN